MGIKHPEQQWTNTARYVQRKVSRLIDRSIDGRLNTFSLGFRLLVRQTVMEDHLALDN